MHCGSDQLNIVAVAFSSVQGVSLVLSVKALTFTSMAAVGELDISKLDISGGISVEAVFCVALKQCCLILNLKLK